MEMDLDMDPAALRDDVDRGDQKPTSLIVAGYPRYMAPLLSANDGFKSRIDRSGGKVITFTGYSPDELAEIFWNVLAQKGVEVDQDEVTKAWVLDKIKKVPKKERETKNARMIVSWIETAISQSDGDGSYLSNIDLDGAM